MAYVIAEPCIGTKDTACVDACPVDCIHPKKDEEKFGGEQMLYIDPVECIDCGACVPVCPVSAIFALEDLPEQWADFAQKNAAFFGRQRLFSKLFGQPRVVVYLVRHIDVALKFFAGQLSSCGTGSAPSACC